MAGADYASITKRIFLMCLREQGELLDCAKPTEFRAIARNDRSIAPIGVEGAA
jgi:hypothetical protein